MSTSKWLHWQPSGTQIMATSPDGEVPKVTKVGSGTFGTALSGESSIIEPKRQPEQVDPIIEKAPYTEVPKVTKALGQPPCPYDIPNGVRLVSYVAKTPPVAVTVCSIVNDVPKFIRHALQELDARLHHPVQIKAGNSVFELLSKLADAGLEVCLEWPPKTAGDVKAAPGTLTSAPPAAATSPNARGIEITDEDIPF